MYLAPPDNLIGFLVWLIEVAILLGILYSVAWFFFIRPRL
jgi:hypothetical protein